MLIIEGILLNRIHILKRISFSSHIYIYMYILKEISVNAIQTLGIHVPLRSFNVMNFMIESR